eukprot:scaffold185075_cov17-Tisochrysis_lutea.AAC.1
MPWSKSFIQDLILLLRVASGPNASSCARHHLTPSKEARLLREAQDHIRTTPAVQAIVADGNATSIRSRCSCLNQALEQGKDALLGTVSNPDVVFWHRLAL